MKTFVFDSTMGYNSTLRLGKIYTTSQSHYIFLLDIHKDLIDYTFRFRMFFKLCRYRIKERIFFLLFNPLNDLRKRELGRVSTRQLMNKYYNNYFDYLKDVFN